MVKRMKKSLSVLLALVLSFALVAGTINVSAEDDEITDDEVVEVTTLNAEPEVEEETVGGDDNSDAVIEEETTVEDPTADEGEATSDENTDDEAVADSDEDETTVESDEDEDYGIMTLADASASTDEDFKSAIESAENGDTVTLEDDINVTVESSEYHYQITKSITVDLGGNTITVLSAPSASRLFDVEGSEVSATIKNGKIVGNSEDFCYAIIAYGVKSFTLKNVEVTGFAGTSSNGDTYAATYFYGDEFNATDCTFSNNTGRKGLYCYGGDITIDGCDISNNTVVRTSLSYGVGLEINYADSVLIENSTIKNNDADESHPDVGGGGCVIYASSDVTFSNNTITGNAAGTDVYSMGGGGIFVWDCTGDLLIDNNTITGNTAGEYGGGIYVLNSGDTYVLDTILIRDNTITGNTVLPTDRPTTSGIYYAYGGGVMIEDHSTHHDGTCIFSGNDISYNKALNDKSPLYGRGGGISLFGDDSGREFWIYSGTFYGNQADWGGAIDFTSKESSALHMYNTLITDNTAVRGGGLWACPTSETTMYETFGGAIYGNTASGTITSTWSDGSTYTYSATGDDIRYESTDSDIYPEIRSGYDDDESLAKSSATVASRAIGDVLMEWYADDVNGRYDADTSEPVDVEADYTNRNTSFGLHGELDEHGQALAEAEAEVIISGNTATEYGGGIATNSTVYFGIDEDTDLTIQKYWQDMGGNKLAESTLPESINVTLVRVDVETGEKEDLETVSLNAENNWSWEFTQLEYEYMTDDEGVATYHKYTYEVREVEDALSEGYEPSYEIVSDLFKDEDNTDYMIISITNTKQALEPEISKYVSDPSFNESVSEHLSDDEADNDDTLEYMIVVDHIADATDLVIHDYLDEQLDIESLEIKSVKLYEKEGTEGIDLDYTLKEDGCTAECGLDGCSFEISLNDELGELTDAAYIEVIFDIQVHEDAKDFEGDLVDEVDNHAGLTYTFFGESRYATPALAETFSFGFDIFKYTGEDTPLDGAQFVLTRNSKYATFDTAEGVYMLSGWVENETDATVMTSDENGMIEIEGLHEGEYLIEEVEAPEGFVQLEAPVTVTITIDENYNSVISVDSGTVDNHTVSIKNEPSSSTYSEIPGEEEDNDDEEPVSTAEGEPVTETETDTVKTNDNTNMLIYVAGLGLSFIVLLGIAYSRRKKSYNR